MSTTDLRVFRYLEFEVLSSETLVPPKPKPAAAAVDERGTKFAAYYALLTRIATDYATQTPSKMADAEIERDFMCMRIKLFHRLDTTPIRNLPMESEAECGRKLALLERFARTLKPVPRL